MFSTSAQEKLALATCETSRETIVVHSSEYEREASIRKPCERVKSVFQIVLIPQVDSN